MIEEHREVVIRVRSVPAASNRRRHLTAEYQLGQELKAMRRQGYEVDLFIRGTWRRKNRTWEVIAETRCEGWRLVGDELHGTENMLPPGDWEAMPSRTPPPELVLRGVRRVA
jgi:hypothetical protein